MAQGQGPAADLFRGALGNARLFPSVPFADGAESRGEKNSMYSL